MPSVEQTQSLASPFLFSDDELIPLKSGGDGMFAPGINGVLRILTTRDRKVEFIQYHERVLGYVKSKMGYPALYPFHPVKLEAPVTAVLMDLDGTSVKSEEFWIWIIEQTTARLLANPSFQLEESDLPHVSGHSVSEHLKYCIGKYCPHRTVEQARTYYFEITHREIKSILDGSGRVDAFKPAEGLKEFLLTLKDRSVRIGLVTSGLYEKAWPEILAAFRQLRLGDPADFYDAIITAGTAIRPRQIGTLGELEAKPHPWLYAEIARVGLGLEFQKRHRIIGIEDSGAGVVSVRLAGFATIGVAGGNIPPSGTRGLCSAWSETLMDILEILQ